MLYFEKLIVWQKAMTFATECVRTANALPRKYQYSFSDQLRRAALSIPSNIAEGSGRNTKKDQAQFYAIAKGSLYESMNILILLSEVEGTIKVQNHIYALAEEIARMLHSLMH